MADALGDTGPVLHLHEIGLLRTLAIFRTLTIPDLVQQEIAARQILLTAQLPTSTAIEVLFVPATEWRGVAQSTPMALQPADYQVLALSERHPTGLTILTDDLALRQVLQARGRSVTGTIGILVKAYTLQLLSRIELETAVDDLFFRSTLHLSRSFRAFVRQEISKLP